MKGCKNVNHLNSVMTCLIKKYSMFYVVTDFWLLVSVRINFELRSFKSL